GSVARARGLDGRGLRLDGGWGGWGGFGRPGPGRSARLFFAFARFGLAQEMAFRANFLIKLLVEAMWLAILLVFYNVVFRQTDNVATWTREEYLFFVGCHYALSGIIETFFLENCTGFSELVRTG